MEINKKIVKTLFKKYWCPNGWKRTELTKTEIEYLKNHNFYFENFETTHDVMLDKVIEIIKLTDKKKVVKAFVKSLRTRRVDLRSALGSYAVGISLQKHKYHQCENNKNLSCKTCGFGMNETIDFNLQNFYRHKWGGVAHLHLEYIYFDLTQFNYYDDIKLEAEDIEYFNKLIETIKNPNLKKLSDATKSINYIKGNKNERVIILEILGYCGILNIPNYEPFYENYIPVYQRDTSNYSKSDWDFPTDLWIPTYGINEDAIKFWFDFLYQ